MFHIRYTLHIVLNIWFNDYVTCQHEREVQTLVQNSHVACFTGVTFWIGDNKKKLLDKMIRRSRSEQIWNSTSNKQNELKCIRVSKWTTIVKLVH